ncbi:MAG TPA: helix-turn-helix domain-containing protein [Candidatus Saccharimonadales bacterium]|nr:helix-turn-helix domain-containing protein [Candidatus Saccharimonadales bacterium]
MLSGYERAYKEIVPAARAALIIELNKKYNIKEELISKYVGITQAAISKYLNGRYSARIKEIVEKIDKATIETYAEKIANGHPEAINKYLCTICNAMNDFDCRFSANK